MTFTFQEIDLEVEFRAELGVNFRGIRGHGAVHVHGNRRDESGLFQFPKLKKNDGGATDGERGNDRRAAALQRAVDDFPQVVPGFGHGRMDFVAVGRFHDDIIGGSRHGDRRLHEVVVITSQIAGKIDLDGLAF